MKKIYGTKHIWSSYVSIEKHRCPECNNILKTVKVSKIIDPKSSEKEDFNFKFNHNTYFIGPIKFVWKEFECPNCKKHLTVKEMKEHEGLIDSGHISDYEREKMRDQNNAKTFFFAVLIGVIIFIIYSLLKL